MKQSTYKKLFKRFWVLFLVPNLYGMEYGVVKHHINEYSHEGALSEQAFVEVARDALGINNLRSPQEAIDTMGELFDAFEIRREIDELRKTQLGGKNLAFYRGNAYMNGLIPTTYGYDNLWLRNGQRSPYKVTQLYEILGFDGNEAKEIEDIVRISNNFPLLMKSVKYSTVKSFWNDIKWEKNLYIGDVLDEYRNHYEDWSHEYLMAAADYIKSLRDLGISTGNLKLNSYDLDKSYYEATKRTQNLFKKYLKKFGKYVDYFNHDDSVKFLNKIDRSRNLDHWIDLVQDQKYNCYTHTEYMIRYAHRHKSTPLWMISFNDVCKNCETMLAETTPRGSYEYNSVVISANEYANSRSRNRLNHLTNFNFLQLQLHPKYFFSPFGSDTDPTSSQQYYRSPTPDFDDAPWHNPDSNLNNAPGHNPNSKSNTVSIPDHYYNPVTHESWHRIDSNFNNAPWHNPDSKSNTVSIPDHYYNPVTHESWHRIDSNFNNAPWHKPTSDFDNASWHNPDSDSEHYYESDDGFDSYPNSERYYYDQDSDSERYYYNQETGSEYCYDSDEGWI